MGDVALMTTYRSDGRRIDPEPHLGAQTGASDAAGVLDEIRAGSTPGFRVVTAVSRSRTFPPVRRSGTRPKDSGSSERPTVTSRGLRGAGSGVLNMCA